MYSEYRLQTLFMSVGEKKATTIKYYIEAGYTSVEDIAKRFEISTKQAHMFHVIHCNIVEARSRKRFGNKTEAYFTETEAMTPPTYSISDLSESEKEIAKKDTSTKLWTWEE